MKTNAVSYGLEPIKIRPAFSLATPLGCPYMTSLNALGKDIPAFQPLQHTLQNKFILMGST